MAPVAGGVADGEEDEAGGATGEGESFRGPELPVDWIGGVGADLKEGKRVLVLGGVINAGWGVIL